MLIKDEKIQEDTVVAIGKFAILWNWFEHYWCNNYCNPQKIRNIAKIVHVDMEKQANLSKVLNERRNWFGQLELDYIVNSLHPGNARASSEEDIETMRQFMEQTGDDLICGCLLVIHRIRNNLMHGIKLLEELDGQIELFNAANAVLESIK